MLINKFSAVINVTVNGISRTYMILIDIVWSCFARVVGRCAVV